MTVSGGVMTVMWDVGAGCGIGSLFRSADGRCMMKEK